MGLNPYYATSQQCDLGHCLSWPLFPYLQKAGVKLSDFSQPTPEFIILSLHSQMPYLAVLPQVVRAMNGVYLGLCWVFVAGQAFLWLQRAGATLSYGAWASIVVASLVAERSF